jgi:hypothetical protein
VFYGEGANVGDFNKDGKADIVSGPFIYEGPEFTMKREFMPRVIYDPLQYSKSFFFYSGDFNSDGWNDIFIIGFPGEDASWYENPQGNQGHWTKHLVLKVVDNESPMLANIAGDEKPELVCMSEGYAGYATPDASDPTKPWTFHRISAKSDGYQRFTHGLGVGDVNGDGRIDYLEKSGWFEQPEKLGGEWKKHQFDFAAPRSPGGAQMYAYDVDGDGDNDVITSLHAHGYGLAWFEHVKEGDKISFNRHLILGTKAEEMENDVQFSQLHAVDLVDMDGDGLKDIVTGKRYWAHGPAGDPDPEGAWVLYWFKLTRDGSKATFTPQFIDDRSGVGTQIVAGDVNGDNKADVVVGNKRGTMLLLAK